MANGKRGPREGAGSTGAGKLIKEFSRRNGWPRREVWYFSDENWEFLKQIPGSFVADHDEHCPVDIETRAYLDVLLEVLGKGKQGQRIVFGYGARWYGTGWTLESAIADLKATHHQLPKSFSWRQIDQMDQDTDWAIQYYDWKARQESAAPGPKADCAVKMTSALDGP